MRQLIEHARIELELAGWVDSGFAELQLAQNVLSVIKLLETQSHSEGSLKLVGRMISVITQGNPLSPLTGKDDEWLPECGGVQQNSRCRWVFRNQTGAWDVRSFEGNQCCTGDLGIKPDKLPRIKFPYSPEPYEQ